MLQTRVDALKCALHNGYTHAFLYKHSGQENPQNTVYYW